MKKILFLFSIILLINSCQKKSESIIPIESKDLGLNVNPSVSKDIVITNNLMELTDSLFSVKNNKKELTSVQIWEFKNGFLNSSHFEYFQDNIVTYIIKTECDNYGRPTKQTMSRPESKEEEIFTKQYDKYGNNTLTEISKNKVITNIFDYTYQYENEKVIKKTTTSRISQRVIEEIDYTYDNTAGNEIQTNETMSLGKLKSNKIYDSNNNLIETVRINLNDSSIIDDTKYIYKNGLLVKLINGKSEYYPEPSQHLYDYNEKKQLIQISYSFQKEKFLGYDTFGNWSKKETIDSNKNLSQLIIRNSVYK